MGSPSIAIEVPGDPPAELSPNWRGHWGARNRASKAAWENAWAEWHNAVAAYRGGDLPWELAKAYITYFCHGPQPDSDNVVARCKAYLDAAQVVSGGNNPRRQRFGAGIIQDDRKLYIAAWTITHVAHRSEARVRIEIRRA